MRFHAVRRQCAGRASAGSRREPTSTSSPRCGQASRWAATTSRATSTASARSARWRRRATDCASSIEAPPEILRYCVEKGSITVDGVSLTVAELLEDAFAVALVPHTLEATTLRDLAPGQPVNLEVDVLAKYVERLVAPGLR